MLVFFNRYWVVVSFFYFQSRPNHFFATMLTDSDSSTQWEYSQLPPSEQEDCDMQKRKDDESTTAQIKLLKEMCEDGFLEKTDLPQMIMNILSKPDVPRRTRKRPHDDKAPSSEAKAFAEATLRPKKRFRKRASPDTVKIRKIIEGPIERRFQRECAKKNSPLFGQVPPKRLNQDLFDVACKSPLEEIYTSNAKVLKDVPSNKLEHIIKWKIRKMRANPLPAKHHVGDNYDFKAAAAKLNGKLFSENAETRRRDFYASYYKSKSRYSHASSY